MPKVSLQTPQAESWPFAEVIQHGKAFRMNELDRHFGTFHSGPYPESPHQALIFPIHLPGAGNNNYLLVTGVSARRMLDEKYRLFYELLAEAIKNALARARAYEDERRKAEALAEIDRAKTLFFSNISHEFRTPLTLMLGSLEELLNNRRGEIGAENKTAVEITHRNAVRLLRLVNNLLDFSRLEAGRAHAQFQLIDIGKYTADLASNFRSVVEMAGLLFHVDTDAVIQPVYLDVAMWEKIVLNLLSNAFKYTLTGSIVISLTTENGEVLLKVKDTGVGIPPDELPKMFQRFHRVENVAGRTYEGTGIGLSMVSELVKLHGGKISVQSEPGQGTEFIVAIPTGKAHLPKEQVFDEGPDLLGFKAALSESFIDEAKTLLEHTRSENRAGDDADAVLSADGTEAPNSGELILVVDDNADMRAYIKSLLQKHYRIITAVNGREALHLIKKHAPRLVVSDIMMPVMDGIELLKAVKKAPQTQHIPVILLSARAGEESKIEGYDIGADDYLVKPFSAKELIARVASQLKLVKMRNAAEANVRNLFMQAPAVICVLRGPHHIYELANEKYAQLIGNRDLIGKPIREALPELAETGLFEILDTVYKTGEPFIGNEMPVSLQRANGKLEESILNFIYQASYNEEGEINGILVHGVEVTEQIAARKKIEESEANFRQLAELMPEKVSVADAAGNLLYFNQRWLNYTGVGFNELKGVGWKQTIHPDDVEEATRNWMHSLATGDNFNGEFRIRDARGQYGWHMCHSVPLKDAGNTIVKWIAATTEINQQKEQRIELEKAVTERTRELSTANAGLLKMNTELESFTYVSSHDLQEPLRKIQTFSAMILKKDHAALSDAGKDYFQRMSSAATRMQVLIADLLDFSHASFAGTELRMTDLNKLVAEVVGDMEDTILEKGAVIKTAELCELPVNASQFRQLLQNLIGNALKFSKTDLAPHILISCEKRSGGDFGLDKLVPDKLYCCVTFTDNGIGFDAAYEDKIFEVFQRLHGKQEYAGTGIGLSIVKKIVANHNGFITATSKINEGARFDIYLPA
jgi:PAS domain S-box-containing protein